MKSNRRTVINVICSLAVLATNILIGFFLSPYIVKTIGVEAYGFVSLTNDFITYAQLIVTALNSMAARFITFAYVQKDYKKANLLYNSVFWGNLLIIGSLLLPAIYAIVRLETLVNVPPDILIDLKILFSFVVFNFFISTGAPNWDCGTYIANRLDRAYIPQMATSVLRCVLLFGMFSIWGPHIWFVGFVSSLLCIIYLFVAMVNTHSLTPELRVMIKPGTIICSKHVIKVLVSAGVWNSISNAGNMLLSGLDLIVCNIAIGSTEMGVLSLSKLLPSYMQQLSESIRNAFAPELTINYANGDTEAVLKGLKRAMKLTSIVLTIPISCVIILGERFFVLWVPTQDAQLLQTLSVLAILGYMFTSGTQILYNVFSTVNKAKDNAIAMLLSGAISISVTLLLVALTDLDMYAVAGVSTFVNLARNMCFTLPATAKYLGLKWYQFFPQVLTSVVSSILLIVIGTLVKPFLPQGSWLAFIVAAIIIGIIGLVVNFGLVLNKEERNYLFGKIANKLKR